MKITPVIGTADPFRCLFLVVVALLGCVGLINALRVGAVDTAFNWRLIMIGPLIAYLLYHFVKTRVTIYRAAGKSKAVVRLELEHKEAELIAEFAELLVKVPIWLGTLSAFGTWGYQLISWLREGVAPPRTLRSIGLWEPTSSWIGLQRILDSLANINVGFYLIVVGFLIAGLFNGIFTGAEDRCRRIWLELRELRNHHADETG